MHPSPSTDEPSRFNISRWALDNPALTRYLMVVLLVMGFAAYFQLGQDEDPPFTFRSMVVQASWPGATAEEVAEQVTSRIERALQDVPYSETLRSYTKPGESLTVLQLRDNTPPAEVSMIWYQTRKKVGDARASMPAGVVGPVFNDEFGDVFGTIVALSADGFSDEELRRQADAVRSRLLRLKDVAKVEIFGAQPERIFVEISHQRLATLGLDLDQVLAQLAAQNAVEGAGVLDAGSENLQVRIGGAFRSVRDIEQLPIRGVHAQTGQAAQLRLGDIAHIVRGTVDPPQVKVRHQGRPVIAVGVAMSRGGDIIRLGQSLRTEIEAIRAALPAGIDMSLVQDQPAVVSRSVGEFVQVLIEAIVIVLAVSFVALGLHTKPLRVDMRPGLVVAITIPLVLAITFVVMYYWGIGLHKISLGSLIIALGLLVDDAIIAVEMMVRKMEEGYDKVRAATFSYELVAMPMLTGTLITAAGFLPIGMAKSATGEYTFSIFAVTTAALLISWLVSVTFVPYLGVRLLKAKQSAPALGPEGPHELFDTPFYTRFRRLVDACVAHRWITLGVTLVVFALGVAGMGRVQQQFFPDSARLDLLVELWLPEGSTIRESEALARRFEARMAKEEGLVGMTTWIGSGVPRFFLTMNPVFQNSNVSQVMLMPRDLPTRSALRERLPVLLATEFPEARTRVTLLPNGPPVQYPVQFRFVGPDPEALRGIAEEAKAIMRTNPAMRGVNDNWNEKVKVLRLAVDQDKARALGVTSQGLAQATRTVLSGVTVGQYREGDRLLDIVLRQPAGERVTAAELAHIYVPTASGRSIPLAQIATTELGWESGVLWREGRTYALMVQGDVVPGMQGATVSDQLWPLIAPLKARLPPGHDIQIAGAVEASGKGKESIAAGLPAMLFVMFTLLVLQLRSVSRAFLVVLTAPMGMAGVAAALLLLNRPFGFVAMLGFIALAGMIMRNSVILIDQIEQDRRRGLPAWDAIVESAVRRFRPIVLTAAAAVLAMIPLTRSEFWGPMAVAIMGGLIVATVSTLLVLPAMYAAWFRIRREPAAQA